MDQRHRRLKPKASRGPQFGGRRNECSTAKHATYGNVDRDLVLKVLDRRQPFLLAQPATILSRLQPGHSDDRLVDILQVLLQVSTPQPRGDARIGLQELIELPDRYLFGSQSERARNPLVVQPLLLQTAAL